MLMTTSHSDMNDHQYIGLVKGLSCACCGAPGPSSAHHLRAGMGLGQRNHDRLVVPLCYECHQGKEGLHGNRALLSVYRKDELSMLADTITRVVDTLNGQSAAYSAEPAHTPGVLYAGEAWLRAAKDDWVRLTLHQEHMPAGNPFLGPEAPTRIMLVAVQIQEHCP